MKKNWWIGIVIMLAACGGNKDQQAKVPEQPQGPLAKSANSEAFNQSFGKMLGDYYALKDHFVEENASAVDQSARTMMISTDSLKLNELKADTNIIATAITYQQSISSELKGLLGEQQLEEKRKSLQMVSDQLYDLIRTVQYDRAIIYHDYCPMAFNDQGANWLSSSAAIRNPYIPKKMISCGEVKDSIDFRPKQ